jgi:hypothetical protein
MSYTAPSWRGGNGATRKGCGKGRGKRDESVYIHDGREVCKQHLRRDGGCDYGDRCKFYHCSAEEAADADLDSNNPDGTRYPRTRYDLHNRACVLLRRRKEAAEAARGLFPPLTL